MLALSTVNFLSVMNDGKCRVLEKFQTRCYECAVRNKIPAEDIQFNNRTYVVHWNDVFTEIELVHLISTEIKYIVYSSRFTTWNMNMEAHKHHHCNESEG